MSKWEKIIEFLKSPECANVHKWYSSKDGWAYLTMRSGRHRIDESWSIENIRDLIATGDQPMKTIYNDDCPITGFKRD